jgi:ferredoxin--NADP+ reductase
MGGIDSNTGNCNNRTMFCFVQTLGKAVGLLSTIALASAGAPPAAFAAKKVVEDVKTIDDTKNLFSFLASLQLLENTKKLLSIGAGAVAAGAAGYVLLKGKKQDFLEADPYWDQSTVPVNVYKNKAPFTGKVVSTKRIVGPKATGETCHIVIDHEGDFPYWEGQSWGVIPPGVREKDGKPHSVRLYSIASSRYGDDMTGKTGSLCVRRATYWCPELKADDPAKKGICSNFLCDTKPGDEVQMTGPAGKVMLLPEEDPNTDYIMVATGTGIAPYRGFIRRLFVEKTPAAEAYKGQAWLFLGVANSDALLYDDEWQDVLKKYPDNFRLDYAISREQENKKGGKMYVQDKVEEYADEIFSKLDRGAHIYFCGLKGMMPGIQDMLKDVAVKKGLDYEEWLKGLKEKKQWHVEVY